MKIRNLYIFLFVFLPLCSCAGYRTTKFSPSSIKIGMSKQQIVKDFGRPFKSEIAKNKGVIVETFYYKEAVDVSSYTYILTTIFTFENSILVKIEQKEEMPPGNNVINLSLFKERNFYRFLYEKTGIEYIYDPTTRICFSYFIDEDDDEVLDIYGIRNWIESLPSKKISIASLANSYNIIGL